MSRRHSFGTTAREIELKLFDAYDESTQKPPPAWIQFTITFYVQSGEEKDTSPSCVYADIMHAAVSV